MIQQKILNKHQQKIIKQNIFTDDDSLQNMFVYQPKFNNINKKRVNNKYKVCKISYFPEPFNNKNKIEVELDLLNYLTKFGLKNATDVDTSQFA